MDENKRIGVILRHLRKKKKMSQIDLAKKAGVIQKTISDIERGKTSATINILDQIFSVLGYKLDPVKTDNTIKVIRE